MYWYYLFVWRYFNCNISNCKNKQKIQIAKSLCIYTVKFNGTSNKESKTYNYRVLTKLHVQKKKTIFFTILIALRELFT